jgi:hypothetical protein
MAGRFFSIFVFFCGTLSEWHEFNSVSRFAAQYYCARKLSKKIVLLFVLKCWLDV